jgi:hypothetical protein
MQPHLMSAHANFSGTDRAAGGGAIIVDEIGEHTRHDVSGNIHNIDSLSAGPNIYAISAQDCGARFTSMTFMKEGSTYWFQHVPCVCSGLRA